MARRLGEVSPPDPFGLMMTLICGRVDQTIFPTATSSWSWAESSTARS